MLGPNGSGKTTLLRALSGVVKPAAGEILLEGTPARPLLAAELARLVGVVPSSSASTSASLLRRWWPWGAMPTADAAARRRPKPVGQAAVRAGAGRDTRSEPLAGRLVTELSGGERQRALIAQTLAQETPILLLDEPLNNLDLNHQLEVMQLLGRLHKSGQDHRRGASRPQHRRPVLRELVLLDDGRIAAQGSRRRHPRPRVILEVFRVRVAVHRQGARPYLTPLWTTLTRPRRE